MRSHLRVRLTVLLAVLLLFAAACGRDDAAGSGETGPGITEDTVRIGSSFPLSGPVAPGGTAQAYGGKAFYDAVNEAGGIEMQDGQTRQIEYIFNDDAYDPARTVQNFRQAVDQDEVLAWVGALGTPTNAAVMPVANEQEVPQVYIATGASLFSTDQETNPWTLGWQPTYEQEGALFGELLVGMDRPLTVAVLRQNDDLGEAYLSGFQGAIDGSQVEIVAEQTYEPTDSTLDSQITNLAASEADALLSAVAFPNLQLSGLTRMIQIQWEPIVLVPVLTAGLHETIEPSGADEFFDELYTTNFVKMPNDPQWADDDDVVEYLDRMETYSPEADPLIANAVWGYATADTMVRTLESMTEMTREGLMNAVHDLRADDIAMLLPGVTLDGSATDAPPVTGSRLQQFGDGQWNFVEQ